MSHMLHQFARHIGHVVASSLILIIIIVVVVAVAVAIAVAVVVIIISKLDFFFLMG